MCGPGLGRTEDVRGFVQGLVDRATVPLVLDADAIIAFADDPGSLVDAKNATSSSPRTLREMARLIGANVDDVQANRIEV